MKAMCISLHYQLSFFLWLRIPLLFNLPRFTLLFHLFHLLFFLSLILLLHLILLFSCSSSYFFSFSFFSPTPFSTAPSHPFSFSPHYLPLLFTHPPSSYFPPSVPPPYFSFICLLVLLLILFSFFVLLVLLLFLLFYSSSFSPLVPHVFLRISFLLLLILLTLLLLLLQLLLVHLFLIPPLLLLFHFFRFLLPFIFLHLFLIPLLVFDLPLLFFRLVLFFFFSCPLLLLSFSSLSPPPYLSPPLTHSLSLFFLILLSRPFPQPPSTFSQLSLSPHISPHFTPPFLPVCTTILLLYFILSASIPTPLLLLSPYLRCLPLSLPLFLLKLLQIIFFSPHSVLSSPPSSSSFLFYNIINCHLFCPWLRICT